MSRIGDTREMAWVLRYLGHVWYSPQSIEQLYREALTILTEKGDESGRAETLYRLGWIATRAGDYQSAARRLEKSLQMGQQLGRQEMALNALVELGYLRWVVGDWDGATEQLKLAQNINEELGYMTQTGNISRLMALVALGRHQLEDAGLHLENALKTYREMGLLGLQAEIIALMGRVALQQGDVERAEAMATDSLRLCREREHKIAMVEPLAILGEVALARGEPAEAEGHLREAADVALNSWALAEALHALVGVVRLFAARNETERAADLATFITSHPATWQWTRERVSAAVDELDLEPAAGGEGQAETGATAELEALIAKLFGDRVSQS